HPKAMMNSLEKVVIDANFSTVWIKEGALVDAYAMLSILNSSWIAAASELIATVLGGGASKLEATHLRKLPIPMLTTSKWSELSSLGYRLTNEGNPNEILNQIDRLIVKAIYGDENVDECLLKIETIKLTQILKRKKGSE